MSWNPVLNMINEIKSEHINKIGELSFTTKLVKNKDTGGRSTLSCLEQWILALDIKKYSDFIKPLQIGQNEDLIIIRYDISGLGSLVGMWEDKNSIYRECRSVVINIVASELVATPFRKFFNINEVEENKEDVLGVEIANSKIFEITNKLDGSMQSARYYKSEIKLFGSMALSINNSWRLGNGYSLLTKGHKLMIEDNPDFTFMFEYVSKINQHVVYYEDLNGLFLIGARNVLDGREVTYRELRKYSKLWNVPMAEIENITTDEMFSKMKTANALEKEGWVLNIDGHKVKIKCDDYCNVHRILDNVSSVNVIIKAVADNNYDDLISKVPLQLLERVKFIKQMVVEFKNNKENIILDYYKNAPKENMKEFMIWVDTNVEKCYNGFVKNRYLNKEYNPLKKREGYIKFNKMYKYPFEYYYSKELLKGELDD